MYNEELELNQLVIQVIGTLLILRNVEKDNIFMFNLIKFVLIFSNESLHYHFYILSNQKGILYFTIEYVQIQK